MKGPATTSRRSDAATGREASGATRRARVERTADALVPGRFQAHGEKILYLAVGGWNTLFGYANFAALYAAFGDSVHVTLILVISYAISIANAYVCYRYIVFRSRGSVLREIPRFVGVYLVALAANLVILPLALRVLPLNAYVVQALFTAAVVVVSYFGHKHVSFRGGAAAGPGVDAPLVPREQGNEGGRETSARAVGSGEGRRPCRS